MNQVATATATFYVIAGNSDYTWRVSEPARAVGGKAVLIPEDGGYFALTEPNDDTAFRWRFDPDMPDHSDHVGYPDHEGTAVWCRPDLARASHARAMREKLGLRTIAETDDNYLASPRNNIYLRANGFSEKDRLDHMKACASMDGIVFSTAQLRDMYWRPLRQAFGRSRLPNMYVCRNHVFRDAWPDIPNYSGPLRVGWMGSPSHIWDVDLAWPALMHARNLGCKTFMVGYDPTGPEHAMTVPRSLEKVAQWRKVGYEFVPWRYLDGRRLALPFDIGLAPLQTNDFTLGKSDIKAIEFAVSGAVPVVQNNTVFREWTHGVNCWKVGGPQQMLDAVSLLVRDAKLRAELVANAQEFVREQRCEVQLRDEWMAAINGD